MMKNFKLYAMGLAMAGALSFTSCAEDYLDTAPTDKIGDVEVIQNLDNLYAALNGIHREMVSQESGLQAMGGEPGFMMMRDCEGDDMTWLANTWMKASWLGWTANMNATSSDNYHIWRIHYQWILNANKILEGLETVPVGTGEEKLFNQIKGEALCIRAFAHFDLVQLYAGRYAAGTSNSQPGIPYRESSEVSEMARHSVEEVYTKINADLDQATTLLAGIKANDVNHYTEKVAWGLKARVALAMQDYTNAATYAEKAIELAEADGHKLMTGSVNDKGEYAGQLFCGFADIATDTDEGMYVALTPDDQTVYFYSFYAFMSWNFSSGAIRQGVKAINADTYDTMSETDLRRGWWDPTGEMEVPTTAFVKTKYQNRKFTARDVSDAVGNVAFMRLAEMYLIAAEAYARGGNDAKAQEVFTKFQVTRDPEYVGNGNTGDALAEEIMNSRRVELWGEGFRFTDLKRLNLPIKRGRNFDITFCTFLEKEAGADGWIWEIPKIETDYNSLCEKNY